MDKGFFIDFCRNVQNLHISIRGEFNGMCAWELIKIIRFNGKGAVRIFVSTTGILGVSEEGVKLFKAHMEQREIERDWLYFRGEKGFVMAPERARVIIPRNSDSPCLEEKRDKRGVWR